LILQLQSATKLRRNRFQRAYTDAASETLNPAASASATATTSTLQLPAITVRLPPATHPPTHFIKKTSARKVS
jgi:hypothetical protein